MIKFLFRAGLMLLVLVPVAVGGGIILAITVGNPDPIKIVTVGGIGGIIWGALLLVVCLLGMVGGDA